MPVPHHEVCIVTDAAFRAHEALGAHPERPARLDAASRGRVASAAACIDIPARRASLEELTRVHDERYIDELQAALAGGRGHLDPDTFFGPGTGEAAWRAAGGACAMVDALLDRGVRRGALLARPPGHHATPTRAMGFCLLNNIAVAAAHARARGVGRVAIVDWDVHHGNGTQEAFEADPSVLFVSLHRAPFYPGTGRNDEVGRGEGRGRTVNVPLPASTGGRTYRAVFEQIVLPVVEEFAPDLLLVSAGFDSHERDPLGGMQLATSDFAWMAAQLCDRTGAPDRPVGLVLEGGYDLRAIEDCVAATLDALSGLRIEDARSAAREQPPGQPEQAAIDRAIEAQRPYWRGAV